MISRPPTSSPDHTLTMGLPSGEVSAPHPVVVTEGAPANQKPFICRRPVRLSIYAFLVLFLLLMFGWRYVPLLLDPTFEKHIQTKRVMVGMSKEQVLKAWGSPYTIHVDYTKDGTRREEWIYEDWKDAATIKHRYLYFEEGILVGGWYYQ